MTPALSFPCPAVPAREGAEADERALEPLPIPWEHFDAPWIAPMAACMQDPEHHAEGDVWLHTRMVCEALVNLPEWRALAPEDREIVFAGALLHDIAKPATTTVEDGRIRHPGHSVRGAHMTRRLLWEAGVPFARREQVVTLVRHHQVPFFLIEQEEPLRRAAAISLGVRGRLLAQVTRADALGRVCKDPQRLLDNIDLYEALCEEHGCLDGAFPFPNPHTRYMYFKSSSRDPRYPAHDATRFEVVLMCGLPGAGKDHWIRENLELPRVSMDDLRRELKLPFNGDQSAVARAARERAREYLRREQSFVWSATNLRKDIRGRLISMFADYGARVRLVYVEAARARQLRQNRERESALPPVAMERMLRQWDIPTPYEAHRVDYVIQDGE